MNMRKTFRTVLTLAAVLLGMSTAASAAINSASINLIPTRLENQMFVDEHNTLWMWGYDTHGLLEFAGGATEKNSFGHPYQPVPMKIMEDVKDISSDIYRFAVIKTDGSLWMWGRANCGYLGNGSKGNYTNDFGLFQLEPIKVMDDVVDVVCGPGFTVALKQDGSVWTWGSNDCGQLGNGGVGNAMEFGEVCQTVPVKVMDGVRSITTYSGSTQDSGRAADGGVAVVKNDNSLWMWGSNGDGQLCDPALGDKVTYFLNQEHRYQTTPIKVMDDIQVAVGSHLYFAVIKTDGTLWTWGRSPHSALGQGHTELSDLKQWHEPAQVLDQVTAVFCDSAHMGAIRTDGSLWMWGSDIWGTLASGITVNRFPSPVKIMDDVSAACGTLAVKSDGTIWTWGKDCGVKGAADIVIQDDPGLPDFPGARTTPVQIPGVTGKIYTNTPQIFSDVRGGDWYCDAVAYLYENGLMSGVGGGLFAPDRTLTRGMVVTILHTLEGRPGSGASIFTDVSSTDWFAPGVSWAADHGIVGGYGDGRFGPNDAVTVEQASCILQSYAKYKGQNVSGSGNLSALRNWEKASSWATASLEWACNRGLFQNMGNRKPAPNEKATRAEIATMMYHFITG